jgi:hypothetical protein
MDLLFCRVIPSRTVPADHVTTHIRAREIPSARPIIYLIEWNCFSQYSVLTLATSTGVGFSLGSGGWGIKKGAIGGRWLLHETPGKETRQIESNVESSDLSKRDISEDIHSAQYLEGVRVSARALIIRAFSTPTCLNHGSLGFRGLHETRHSPKVS